MFDNNTYKQFELQLLQLINNCHLPIAGAYYVLKSVLSELKDVYTDALTQEANRGNEEQVISQPITNMDISDVPQDN